MNVLAVAPHFPPRRIGGVEAYAHAVVTGLHARGHAVSVAAVEHVDSGDDEACESERDDAAGYPVQRLTLTIARGRPFELVWDHAGAEAWFVAHFETTRPQVVHLHSGYLLGGAVMAAARRCRVPYVVTLHDYWFSCPRITRLDSQGGICSGPEGVGKCTWCLLAGSRRARVPDRWLLGAPGWLLRRAVDAGWPVGGITATAIAARQQGLAEGLRDAALIISPTRFVADSIEAIGVPASRVLVSPHGLPPLRVERHEDGAGLRLSYIGQVVPHKGVHLLIDAVRALPGDDLRLDIHGPLTPRPDYVEALRAAAGGDDRIRFVGPYTRDRLPHILSRSDLVVVPSVWHEVAGLVIMEAHAAGVPVLASRLGGIPEVVADGVDGLLFEPFAPGDLLRQLTRLRSEPGLLTRLRSGIRAPRTNADDVEALIRLLEGVVGPS
jgi:glycosyltransferase involved in cell wall biosynthesis